MRVAAGLLLQQAATALTNVTTRRDRYSDLVALKARAQAIKNAYAQLSRQVALAKESDVLEKNENFKVTNAERDPALTALLELNGRVAGVFIASDEEMSRHAKPVIDSEVNFQRLLAAWNDKLNTELERNPTKWEAIFKAKQALYPLLTNEHSRNAIVETDKQYLRQKNTELTERATSHIATGKADKLENFSAIFDEKKKIAQLLYSLELPSNAENSAAVLNPIVAAIDMLKDYAQTRYRDPRRYTNWFRLGASRETKLLGALKFCDKIVLNTRGETLTREGIKGITRGTLGRIVGHVLSTLTTAYDTLRQMFVSATSTSGSGSTGAPLLLGKGGGNRLSQLKDAVTRRNTFLNGLREEYLKRFGETYQRYSTFVTQHEEYLQRKNAVCEYKSPFYSSEAFPADGIRQAEVTEYLACLSAASAMLHEAGTILCSNTEKKPVADLSWICEQQIAVYEASCAVQENPLRPVGIPENMKNIKSYILSCYQQQENSSSRFWSSAPSNKQKNKQKLECALKCLKLLATTGTITSQQLSKDEIALIDTNSDLKVALNLRESISPVSGASTRAERPG